MLHVTFLHSTWPHTYVCKTTYSSVRQFICATCLIHMCDMTHSYAARDLSPKYTWPPAQVPEYTDECVTSYAWMSHVAHINESRCIYKWVTSHIWLGHVAQMSASCHTYEWVVPLKYAAHMNVSRYVAHMNELRYVAHMNELRYVAHINTTRMSESCL